MPRGRYFERLECERVPVLVVGGAEVEVREANTQPRQHVHARAGLGDRAQLGAPSGLAVGAAGVTGGGCCCGGGSATTTVAASIRPSAIMGQLVKRIRFQTQKLNGI